MWPRTEKYHITVSQDNLRKLTDIALEMPEGGFADHIVGYTEDRVVLEWYDAGGPIHISESVVESSVVEFARLIGSAYEYHAHGE